MGNALFFLVLALAIAFPHGAQAYIGPGAGITAIGTVIALIGAVVLGIVGFVWYPVKRLRAKLKNSKSEKTDGPETPAS